LTALLDFPKFHHWVDYKLLYQAYTSTVAQGRYHVVIDEDLMEHGKQELKRCEEEREQEEKLQRKRQERQRQREKEREQRYQERYEVVMEKVRPCVLEDTKEWLREERLEQEAAAKAALLEESSVRGYMERNRTWMAPALYVWEGVESLMKPPPEEDTLTLEDVDDDEVEEAIENFYYEEFWDYLHFEGEYEEDEEDWSDGEEEEEEEDHDYSALDSDEDDNYDDA